MTELPQVPDVDSAEVLQESEDLATEQIKRSTALMLMRSTEGWEILLDTFEAMKADQLDELYRQVPGDEKAILAAHAVWHATVHALNEIVRAVNSEIQKGETAAEFLQQANNPEQNNDWN